MTNAGVVNVIVTKRTVVVRAGLRNSLEGLPHLKIAGEMGNGCELMDALSRLKPDLLSLDANMPDFDPISAVRRIKTDRPELKILIVSEHDNEAYVVGLLNAGVVGWVSCPHG